MSLSLIKIALQIHAELLGENPDAWFENVSLDSRSLQNNNNTLFFCIKGTNYNSHKFIPELIEQGVLHFVVSEIPEDKPENINFLVVEDTLKALQDFAVFYRKLFDFPIIGITGSNGKTIVKEWLSFLLSPEYNIIRSPKSYNSQVGVPLSIIGINEKHNFGIFEAGISTINEMDRLEEIIQPSIGILTNIGPAHDEGFQNLAEKIKEKLKLFQHVSVLIYNKNKSIDAFIKPTAKTFSWSSSDKDADVLIHHKTIFDKTTLNVTFKEKCFKIEIPFSDEASIENVIHCVMVLLYFDYSLEIIQKRISMLYPIEMRLKVKKGINNTSLIDDSYSSDFQSLKIALDFLENQKKHPKKTLILSDIFQSGLSNEELYSKVSQLIISNKISRVIGIGETISQYQHKFLNGLTFKNQEDFLKDYENLNFENETILIKGARSFHFEEIVSLLEEKTHETVLEINLNSVSHNLNYYKTKIDSKTKMMVMVKAFGYGNGFEIAKLLEYHKVDYLGVAFADEGITLRNNGIELPILVLNPENTSFNAMIQYHLEPEIYSIKGLDAFLKIAKQKNLSNYPIHIKIDSGMHRLGFEEIHLEELITTLKENKNIQIKSVFSHMATSDSLEHHEFALSQIALFEKLSTKIMKSLHINPIRHILNTSGISNYPQAQYDMVRLGIGLYGISNNASEQKYLENVGTLKSIISQIRTIQKGESVGYGRMFIAQKESKIATIPIGYADGIHRNWGNEVGYVMIQNQKAPIVGNICMDMLMVDVTNIPCIEGNQVVIFGENPSVSFMADKLNTISYEILTSISQRVKRTFFRE